MLGGFSLPYDGVNKREGGGGFERPETWVTLRTGHMGNTFRPLLGGRC